MPSELDVRPVRPEEHDAAGRLVLAAYTALEGSVMSGGYAVELADVAGRVTAAEVLVALDGDALLGCVTFVPDHTNPWAEHLEPGEASIRMLAVDPAAQGRGAGQALLDACIARARQLDRAAIFLHSTSWMDVAQRMYLRAGFERTPDRDWLPMPEVQLTAFRLAL